MTDAALADLPGPGHNQPPDDIEILRQRLTDQHGEILTRKDELIDAAGRAPEKVESDDVAGKMGDFVKQITACRKSAETARVSSKEPFLAGTRAVDGFFKPAIDGLDGIKKTIEGRITAYLRAKEKTEREAREAEERAAKAEAERVATEATKKAAEASTDAELDQAVSAEDAARQAQADAHEAQLAAEAKPADLSRTRGDLGSVASLRTVWVGEVTDYEALPLDALRPHIPRDALDKAVRAYVKAGGRELTGANIFEQKSAVVR